MRYSNFKLETNNTAEYNKACHSALLNSGKNSNDFIIITKKNLENEITKTDRQSSIEMIKELMTLLNHDLNRISFDQNDSLFISVKGLNKANRLLLCTSVRVLYEGYSTAGNHADDFWKIGYMYRQIRAAFPNKSVEKTLILAYNFYISLDTESRLERYLSTGHMFTSMRLIDPKRNCFSNYDYNQSVHYNCSDYFNDVVLLKFKDIKYSLKSFKTKSGTKRVVYDFVNHFINNCSYDRNQVF